MSEADPFPASMLSRPIAPLPNPKVDRKAPLTSAEKALRESLLPQEFRDVHFYAFSRRTILVDGSVRVDHPLPIVAIGSILKETEHFSKLLTSGFAETSIDSNHEIRQYAHEYEYDYESDSDLDEFEYQSAYPTSPVAGGSVPSKKGKHKDKAADEPEANEIPEPESAAQVTHIKHHQVFIPNIAHKTLKACIFYLYTGKINFLPLTSCGKAQRQFAMLTTADKLAPPCSPKSIYRLAESYGITPLQNLAYDAIISQLAAENIVKEAFSSFFARYDRLREHAVSELSQHYSHPAVQEVLPEIIDSIVQGQLIHAGGVLRSLLGLRVAIKTPRPVILGSPLSSEVEPCAPLSQKLWSVALALPSTSFPSGVAPDPDYEVDDESVKKSSKKKRNVYINVKKYSKTVNDVMGTPCLRDEGGKAYAYDD